MLNRLLLTAIICLALVGAASCGSDSSSTTYSVSGDCAVTALTMGTLTRTVSTTTSAGNDTTYSVSVAGSAYPLYIDQLKQEIYNPDSLPVGTNVRKVVFSSVSCDGALTWRTDYGNDTLFSTTDTIDFSQPRLFTSYSTDGTQQKTYRVSINVHNSNSEELTWATVAEGISLFSGISAQRLFAGGGRLTVLAVKDGCPVVLQADAETPTQWTTMVPSGLGSLDPGAVQRFGGYYYYADGGTLKRSADGAQWVAVEADQGISALLATGKDRLYGLSGEQLFSSADGLSWSSDGLDGSAADLPTEGRVSVWSEMSFNDNFHFVLLCGQKDGEVCVWKKIVDSSGADTEPWSLFPQGENGRNSYPALEQGALFPYDGKVLYLGLSGGCVSHFYLSSDGGRNWVEQTEAYNEPEGLEAEAFSVAVDEEDYIWLTLAPSGKVLRGRLNRLSYGTNQKVFTD